MPFAPIPAEGPIPIADRSLITDLGWTGAGIGAAMALDLVFYVLAGRLLGPVRFGAFGVVMAVYYVLVGPLSRTLETSARKIAAEGKDAVAALGVPALRTGLAVWAVFLLAVPVIGGLSGVPSVALLVFSPVFPLAYLLAVGSGALQGLERFRAYAAYEVVSSVAKLSALGLVLAGLGLTGAVAAPVIDAGIGLLVVGVALYPFTWSSATAAGRSLLGRSGLFILAVYAAFSIDVVLVKLFLGAEMTGLYNAVAVIGKGVFFGAVAINRTVFARFADGRADRGVLHACLGLLLVGGAVAFAGLSVVGAPFIAVAFGADFVGAASFAPLYMVFITAVSAVAVVGNYYLSVGRSLRRIVLLPVLETVGILLVHGSVGQVLYAGTAAAVATFLLLYLPVIRERGT